MKKLKIKQIVLGQEVEIEISLDKNNFVNVNDTYYEKFKYNLFDFITENFYSIISREKIVFNTSGLENNMFCYGINGNSQPHKFYFIFEGIKYCFTFYISKDGKICIRNEEYKICYIDNKFNNLLEELDCYSDKNYYSYFIQRLNEIS